MSTLRLKTSADSCNVYRNENDMTTEQLLHQFKYYHQEEKCPFGVNSKEELWWLGEKAFFQACQRNSSYFEHIVTLVKEVINSEDCPEILKDRTLSLERMAIIAYLSLWHGKHFPYDNCDIIEGY